MDRLLAAYPDAFIEVQDGVFIPKYSIVKALTARGTYVFTQERAYYIGRAFQRGERPFPSLVDMGSPEFVNQLVADIQELLPILPTIEDGHIRELMISSSTWYHIHPIRLQDPSPMRDRDITLVLQGAEITALLQECDAKTAAAMIAEFLERQIVHRLI
jgi:hypothetical protein